MPHVPDASGGQSFARSLLDLALPFMVSACYQLKRGLSCGAGLLPHSLLPDIW